MFLSTICLSLGLMRLARVGPPLIRRAARHPRDAQQRLRPAHHLPTVGVRA